MLDPALPPRPADESVGCLAGVAAPAEALEDRVADLQGPGLPRPVRARGAVEADVADQRTGRLGLRDRIDEPPAPAGVLTHLLRAEPQEAAVVLVRPAGWDRHTRDGSFRPPVVGEQMVDHVGRERHELQPLRADGRGTRSRLGQHGAMILAGRLAPVRPRLTVGQRTRSNRRGAPWRSAGWWQRPRVGRPARPARPRTSRPARGGRRRRSPAKEGSLRPPGRPARPDACPSGG